MRTNGIMKVFYPFVPTGVTIEDIDALETLINDHIADSDNPHQTTLEKARTANNTVAGDINMGGYKVTNLGTPTAASDAVNKSYADSLITSVFKYCGTWPGTGNNFPTTIGSGTAGAIMAGDTFEISASCTIQGIDFDQGDVIHAKIDTPGQTTTNWVKQEHNVQQATESERGTARIIDTTTIQDETTTEDTKFVTGKKFWEGILRMYGISAIMSNKIIIEKDISISASDIDWQTGNCFYKTLTGNATFTFSNTANGQCIRVKLKQDATGGRTVTWPGTILWPGGVAPTQTTTASKSDIYTFMKSDGEIFGAVQQNF